MTESTTIDIKSEPIEANNPISTTSPMTAEITSTAPSVQVKSEEEEVYDSAPVTDSFVIYEFDETVKPAFDVALTKSFPPSIQPIIINTKLRKKRKLNANSATTSTPAKKVAKAPLQQLADVNVAIPTTSSSVTAHPLKSTQNATELKVKCLCHLGNTSGPISNGMDLRIFFEEMFEQTRQLSKSQQRSIKLALLEAISEAEEYVDAGKCCEKCCLTNTR